MLISSWVNRCHSSTPFHCRLPCWIIIQHKFAENNRKKIKKNLKKPIDNLNKWCYNANHNEQNLLNMTKRGQPKWKTEYALTMYTCACLWCVPWVTVSYLLACRNNFRQIYNTDNPEATECFRFLFSFYFRDRFSVLLSFKFLLLFFHFSEGQGKALIYDRAS